MRLASPCSVFAELGRSGIEGLQQVCEVVAGVVDLGAHGMADEIHVRVGDDLLDGLPMCFRVQPSIEVLRLENDGHAVMSSSCGVDYRQVTVYTEYFTHITLGF